MKRLTYLLPLLLFAVLAGYFALGLTRDPSLVPSALIDRPVPSFDLAGLPGAGDLQAGGLQVGGLQVGGGLASTDLKGRVQLVNVFASWCAPCRAEAPLLMRLAKENGIPIYGLNQKDRPQDALEFLKRFGNPYTAIGADPDGKVSIDWGVYGVPETYLIDAEGRIRYRHVGPITADNVDGILALIRQVQAQAPGKSQAPGKTQDGRPG